MAMAVATDLGTPAVRGIEEALLERFGAEILDDRIKQMIGHMVRQVMERRGFIVDQMDVKLNSIPFAKATRYRKKDAYQVHVFRNTLDGRDVCMTATRKPRNLPGLERGGRWRYWRSFRTELRGRVAFGMDLREIGAGVEANGYTRTRLQEVLGDDS